MLMNDHNSELNMMGSVSENGGCSVTSRIKQVKQPRGGYINPKAMTVKVLGEGIEALNPNESTSSNLVGLAVDYLTRFMIGADVESAFFIAFLGAKRINKETKAKKLMAGVKGLDSKSVINAVKLCGFDVYYRKGPIDDDRYNEMADRAIDDIMPDDASIENIITMVNRSLAFFEGYGPAVLEGFTFEGGYTDVVSAGDGDFITKDTLWDIKTSKNPITKDQTLQLLMYWRMGLHSIHPEFKDIQYLGIYNPRQNIASRIAVTDIPEEVIKEVDTYVIGYK